MKKLLNGPEDFPPPPINIQWQAGTKVFMLMPTGMTTPTGAIINPVLKASDGKVEIKLPQDLFPFLKLGIPVCVGLVISSADAKLEPPPAAKSSIIRP